MAEQNTVDEDMTPDQRVDWLRERGVFVETSEERKNGQPEHAVKEKNNADDISEDVTFVHVPQNESKPLQQLSFRCCRNKHHGDKLIEHLKPYFGSDHKAVDVELLQNQAQKNFGSADALTQVSIGSLQAVAEQGNVESFTLVHPVPSNKFTAVNIYLDEVGLLKRLPINKRAGDFARKAGFNPPPVFYGDVFIGRMMTKPTIKNECFNLGIDTSPDADWLKKSTIGNLEYQSAMNEVTGKMDELQPSADGEDGNVKTEQNGLYSWTQNDEEVEISIALPQLPEKRIYSSADIKVKFLPSKLSVTCRGINFFNLDLFSKVDPDGCTW
eukprot:CAMPEP_0197832964 /NCGR_PEP_ID=MMETSP1437-20131217/17132_1 /TAXON_ID=49252 ORGANISM="Eucampia antarctica, Strain CCMP1452" /NCGR_SAMPLE_ID=MMETSP1437 /ASSEMBLY_ACC=CAM_ASM_001096 /LENGTH=326 /DNA_ID=CAMNT_0043436657 /DNA_START=21 /DNA_END=998 /DNA_ORIENTATION=-